MLDEELQKEWREMVINKLNNLEISQNEIKKEISELKINMPSPAILLDQEARLRTLEVFKERGTMLFFVVQFLIGIIVLLLEHYWK